MCVYSPIYKAIHMYFPRHLRTIREERALSLEEMAEKLGLAVMELERYESGYSAPTLDTVKNIASALSIETHLLIGLENITYVI